MEEETKTIEKTENKKSQDDFMISSEKLNTWLNIYYTTVRRNTRRRRRHELCNCTIKARSLGQTWEKPGWISHMLSTRRSLRLASWKAKQPSRLPGSRKGAFSSTWVAASFSSSPFWPRAGSWLGSPFSLTDPRFPATPTAPFFGVLYLARMSSEVSGKGRPTLWWYDHTNRHDKTLDNNNNNNKEDS